MFEVLVGALVLFGAAVTDYATDCCVTYNKKTDSAQVVQKKQDSYRYAFNEETGTIYLDKGKKLTDSDSDETTETKESFYIEEAKEVIEEPKFEYKQDSDSVLFTEFSQFE